MTRAPIQSKLNRGAINLGLQMALRHTLAKICLVALSAAFVASPASAATVTGTYTASISGGHATLTDNLASPFSLTTGLEPLFITANPGICYPLSSCSPTTGTITVIFSNLTVNGHNFGGFTETGLYTANYSNQTDSIVWNGATAQSGFGLMQDNGVPLVFTKALNGGSFGILSVDLVDGSDWNVQTKIEAQFAAATPIPGTLVLFGSGTGLLGLLMTGGKRRRKQVV